MESLAGGEIHVSARQHGDGTPDVIRLPPAVDRAEALGQQIIICLLYTSDAADE